MLSKKQLRMTRQRRVILDELGKVKSHPTADQIYEMVRKRLPRISLATVYRNLDILSEAGEILKLELGGTQRRYDGDTSPHCHIRCERCGRVSDVEMEPMALPRLGPDKVCGFSIQGYRLEFFGICPDCMRHGNA